MSLSQSINNTLAAKSNTTGPSEFPHSAHQVFVENVFSDNGPFTGIFAQLFRIFTKTLVNYDDFVIGFHFAKGEWHIRVKPVTSVGKFAIQQMKESVIKSELSRGPVC